MPDEINNGWMNREDQEATLNFMANLSAQLPSIRTIVVGVVNEDGGMIFHLAGPAWALMGAQQSLGECIKECSCSMPLDPEEDD